MKTLRWAALPRLLPPLMLRLASFMLAWVLLTMGSRGWAQVERLPSVVEPVLHRLEVQEAGYNDGSLPVIAASQPASWTDSASWDQSYIVLPSNEAADYFDGIYNDSYALWVLPEGLIYRSYLAGLKEPRFAAHIVSLRNDSTVFDANLGSRVSLLRWGTPDPLHPSGIELVAEGSAQVRLDIPEDVDVRSVDFRGGVLLCWGDPRTQWKAGYYHLSSHLGDEFLLKNPGFTRLNYAKDVLIVGYSIYPLTNLRFYAETGWAFYEQISQQWEFQFGVEYAPMYPTGLQGAPFFAFNVHLREEVNYGGNIVAEAGWAWRSDVGSPLLRLGALYYNGESSQYSFYDDYEEQIGLGLWYDY